MTPTKILVVDNYDSFVFNLVQYLGQLGAETTVVRNDEISAESASDYDGVLISPGPGTPEAAGVSIAMIKYCAEQKIPLFGVCLGHQAIGEAFGAKLVNLDKVYHGVATPITVTNGSSQILKGMGDTIEVGRYHSWIVSDKNFPEALDITAVDSNGFIMGLQHKKFDVQGVQFHPESVLTPNGEKMMRNWLGL